MEKRPLSFVALRLGTAGRRDQSNGWRGRFPLERMMAIQVVSEVWEHSQASGTALLILLALADRARKEDGVCWPGVSTVAHQARVTPQDVLYHRKRLLETGELRIVRKGGAGPRDTTIYQVAVGRYATILPQWNPEKALRQSTLGDNRANGQKSQPVSAKPISPDPLVDPSEPTNPSAGNPPKGDPLLVTGSGRLAFRPGLTIEDQRKAVR